jgi:hypothetical protein
LKTKIRIGLIGTTAFTMGFGVAWLMFRPSEIDAGMATFFGPYSQFTTSAGTVIHLQARRDADAIELNCRSMRTSLIALQLMEDDSYPAVKARYDHLMKTAQCPD